MWPWLFMLSLLLPTTEWRVHAQEIPASSNGPVSSEEAQILWQDGESAYRAGAYPDAALKLERLVERYPGYAGYLDAHLHLGRCFLEMKKFAQAIPPLHYYISAGGAEGDTARTWLGRAYLGEGHYNEAYLETIETERLPSARAETRIAALLIKAQALIGLGHDSRAELAMAAAKKELAALPGTPLRAEASWVDLKLKTRACARFPSSRALDEDVLRDQYGRRGLCLNEALRLFLDTVNAGEAPATELAEAEITSAYDRYSKLCHHPDIQSTRKRTQKELTRYRKELASVLEQDCQQVYSTAIEILKTAKGTNPVVARVEKSLEEDTKGSAAHGRQ